jgi:uncharacterized protein YwqG
MPNSGLLYVFYDQEQTTWGFDPKDKDSWRVLYFDETDEIHERRYPDDIDVRYIPELTLEPKIITTYSTWEDEELVASVYGDCPAHQLGGYPMPEQDEIMDLECQLTSNGLYTGDGSGYRDPRAKDLENGRVDWILLLQIDSNEETFMWGDCGKLYFWIKKDDLSNLNFDDVWMILQCG